MTMEKQLKEIEYFLGRSEHNGYKIIEHNTKWPQGEGVCVFDICDLWISDGDGHPAIYNSTYVKISKEVYKHAIDMFRSAGEKMDSIGCENSNPIDRDLMVGDCIEMGGDFLKVVDFNQGEPVVTSFYYDFYDLNIDLDPDRLSKLGIDVSELKADGNLIKEENFTKALSVAEEAIRQIMVYLEPYFKKQR